jgi:hypothetical protein
MKDIITFILNLVQFKSPDRFSVSAGLRQCLEIAPFLVRAPGTRQELPVTFKSPCYFIHKDQEIGGGVPKHHV